MIRLLCFVNLATQFLSAQQAMTVFVRGPFGSSLNSSENGKNLVIAARDAFRANGGACGPVAIILDKNPVGAGLGGGSADAAATLRALNKLASTPLSDNQLFATAATLGSDAGLSGVNTAPYQRHRQCDPSA